MKTITFKLNPIRAAIMGSILMAANGAAVAAPVNTTLEFTCFFPIIENQTIIANISGDYPESIEIPVDGSPVELPPTAIEVIATVPDRARAGLSFASAESIKGVAHSINTFHTAAGDIPNNTDLDIPETEVPAGSGPFDMPANGVTPAQSFDLNHLGAVSLTVDDLIMDIVTLRADGSVAAAPIGEFTTDCTLNPGQDNVLTTIQVTTPLLEPEIEVEPTGVDFGGNLLGVPSEGSVVTIRNIGGQALGVNGISVIGADDDAFSETNNCTTVAAGESCTATVTYTASAEGPQNASLEINSTDADEPTVLVTLSGTGAVEEKPEIEVTPIALDFAKVVEGTITEQTVLIKNTGTAPLVISVDVDNTQGAEFSATENCSSIAAGDSCTETVTFEAVEGVSAGNVVISSNDDDEATTLVSLSGEGEKEIIIIDECELDPSLPECNDDLIIKADLDVEGSTYIAANHGTVPLTGVINSEINVTQGTFTGDLNLDPTQGSFEIIQGWKRYQATAQIEFEPVGETVGTLVDGVLVATAQAYVKLPKVTKTLFGWINWKIGGGDECRTKEPVTFTIASADGVYFEALTGGEVTGTYTMSELENCGLLTSILSSKLAGPGNTISLDLTPDL